MEIDCNGVEVWSGEFKSISEMGHETMKATNPGD